MPRWQQQEPGRRDPAWRVGATGRRAAAPRRRHGLVLSSSDVRSARARVHDRGGWVGGWPLMTSIHTPSCTATARVEERAGVEALSWLRAFYWQAWDETGGWRGISVMARLSPLGWPLNRWEASELRGLGVHSALVWLCVRTECWCIAELLGMLNVRQCPHRSHGERMGTLEVICPRHGGASALRSCCCTPACTRKSWKALNSREGN